MWQIGAAGYLWGALIVASLTHGALAVVMERQLKRRHPDVWRDLGAPSLFKARTIIVDGRWIAFIWMRRYKKLGDAKITLIGDADFACGILVLLIFLYWLFFAGGQGVRSDVGF